MSIETIKSPSEVYKEYHSDMGLMAARANVFSYFLDNYFKPTPKSQQRQVRDFKQLFAGRIYTFQYDPLYKDVLDFYDKRPIILALKCFKAKTTNNIITVGINLNFIPNKVRLNLLDLLFRTFKKMIAKDLAKRKEDSYNGVPSYIFSPDYDYYGLVEYIFQKLIKSGYKYAIRSYIFTRMKYVSFIEYEDWGIIPLIESKEITGAPVQAIHAAYWNKEVAEKMSKKK